jgi:hypothetical protein
MDETLRSTNMQNPLPLSQDREHFLALKRGSSLLADLNASMIELHQRFPDVTFILEDRYGISIRTIGAVQDNERSQFKWDSIPLLINGHEFGHIRYIGALGKLMYSDIAPIILSLAELEHWAQIEGERRGEKVQKLLKDGVTPEVVRLLLLCGLTEYPGYTLVAMELCSRTDKYLYMDMLRKFMLAHMWAYHDTLDFVAYRPGGLVGIFPGCEETHWEKKWELWIKQWSDYQSRIGIKEKLEVRACITSVNSLYQLDHGVRRVDSILQFADRWNLTGLIRPRVSHALTYILSNLSKDTVFDLVHSTLGPILVPEHTELLHTLRVYLFLDQNVTEAAKTLYIHRNTLLYRIRHIEKLLGIKLRNTAQLSTVWSALEGLELLESSGHNSFRGF